MSGSEWNKYLNGGTSQYNFSYKSNTPPNPISAPSSAPTPAPAPIPSDSSKKIENTKNNINPNIKNKLISGGKRKTRRLTKKRKTLRRNKTY